MAFIVRRSSRMAIVKEVVEGTPVPPSSGTDFIPLQDDYEITSDREALENAELTGSIGQAATVPGVEAPTISFSGYLKHSGTEGQAPNYGAILESIWGSVNTYSAAEATVVSSTLTEITVGVGEGANYARGIGVLVKDSANGYSIRTVVSVAGDVLSLNAPLAAAPGAGVKLGLPITYIPTDDGHPSISCWEYEGNGGAIQTLAGVKFLGWNLTADAGQMLNGSFNGEGTISYFDPLTTTATSKFLDFSDSAATVFAISIVEKTYRDPEEIALALQNAMNAAGSPDTFAVIYDNSLGKFNISSDASPFSILWSSGANAANSIGAILGYDVAADDTGAQSYESDNAQDWSSPIEPIYDPVDPLVAKSHQLLFRRADDLTSPPVCVEATTVNMNPTNTVSTVGSICSSTGVGAKVTTGRSVTMSFSAPLKQNDASQAAMYRRNDTVIMQYAFGEKADGTNFDAGKSGCFSTLTAKITDISIGDTDGVSTLEITLQAFVASGLGETYLNFL